MLFNSWGFLGLLLITFLLYYALSKTKLSASYQVGLLLFSSLFFYAYDKPLLVVLLILSIVVNYFASKAIVLASGKSNIARWVTGVVIYNLLVLALFKYGKLICLTLFPDGFLSTSSIQWIENIPLPIGISFYTFQAISLVIDLKRNGEFSAGMEKLEDDIHTGKKWTSFLNISFYIAFFPQLIAGPIVKAHDFIQQISVKHLGDIEWDVVTRNLIIGYFLKMYVADNLKEVTVLINTVNLNGMGRVDLLLLFYGYSVQIFADFSGYSLIAIGLGALFGYKLPVNFNFPYLSKSITDFWRRWHISLSSWLREYLYIPLGGNRKGAIRTYINLMLVMLIGGLWHGAAWSYMVWGGLHGVILALERFINLRIGHCKIFNNRIIKMIQMLIVFHVVSVLWLLFVMPDFTRVIEFMMAFVVGAWALSTPQNLFVVAFYASPVVLYHLYAYLREEFAMFDRAKKRSRVLECCALSVMLFLVIVNSGTTGEFIYFQF